MNNIRIIQTTKPKPTSNAYLFCWQVEYVQLKPFETQMVSAPISFKISYDDDDIIY